MADKWIAIVTTENGTDVAVGPFDHESEAEKIGEAFPLIEPRWFQV